MREEISMMPNLVNENGEREGKEKGERNERDAVVRM